MSLAPAPLRVLAVTQLSIPLAVTCLLAVTLLIAPLHDRLARWAIGIERPFNLFVYATS